MTIVVLRKAGERLENIQSRPEQYGSFKENARAPQYTGLKNRRKGARGAGERNLSGY